MTENAPATVQTPATSTVENLLADIAAKLGELVQIETYLANKVAQAPAQIAAAAAPVAQPAAPAVAPVAAPAQPAQPAAPPSRPGEGTIGGLVWQYCDGLNGQLGRAPTKEELLSAIKQYSPTFNGQPVNELTAATQYSKWRAAQGLPRLPRGFGAQNKAAAAPAPAPAASVAVAQPAPVAAPVAPAPVAAPVAPPMPAPIPAAAVPSVIAPAAVPASSLPPWLR